MNILLTLPTLSVTDPIRLNPLLFIAFDQQVDPNVIVPLLKVTL